MYATIKTQNFIKNLNKKKPSVFFDIDHTIIRPAKGKKMYSEKDNYEWVFMYSNTVQRLRDITSKFQVYFVTNQLRYTDIVKKRFQDMLKLLNIDTLILISTDRNEYRKPAAGLVNDPKIPGGLPKITSKSFHCGDALGREKDFSDDDLWFAVHAGVQIYSPEEFFDTDFKFITELVSYDVPLKINTKLIKQLENIHSKYDGIMLIGLPGSGKSSIRKWYEDKYTNITVYNNDVSMNGYNPNKNPFYILDNTNMTNSLRNKYPKNILKLDIKKIFIDLPTKDCIRGVKYRNLFQGGEHIPDVVLHTMKKYAHIPDDIFIHLTERPVLDSSFPPYLTN